MGARGPKPASRGAKILRGTFRRDRDTPGMPQFPPGVPRMPSWMPDAAKAEWRRVVPLLLEAGVLTLADKAALTCFVCAVAEVEQLTILIGQEGRTTTGSKGQDRPSPLVSQLRSAWSAVQRFGACFGLDPNSRGRVQAAPPPAEQSDRSKSLARFFSDDALGAYQDKGGA